jgi:hypothetical protein
MKYLKSANLIILKTWLLGGYIDYLGNQTEGFHCLTHFNGDNNEILTNNKIDKTKLKKAIIDLIDYEGHSPCGGDNTVFKYYNENYRFKIPTEKNLNILVNRIFNDLEEHQKWQEE